MDSELYKAWTELFSGQPWPGGVEAVREMGNEIRSLRMLTDTIVTSALEEKPMQSRHLVEMAHDTLAELIHEREVFHRVIQPEERPWVIAALGVLCWMLQHDGDQFARRFETIKERLEILKIFAGENFDNHGAAQ